MVLVPGAALCELFGIDGLMGAGSTGFGSVVIECRDVADPGGFGSAVLASPAVEGAPEETDETIGLTVDAVPFVPMMLALTVEEEAAGAGEAAGVALDVDAEAIAGLVAGAVGLGEGLTTAGVASFFWVATCCCLMRSFRWVTRYACSTCRACWAPRPSICANCPALRWPNTCGLR